MTIELTGLAVAFSLVLGIAAGIVSAVRRDRAIDNVTRVGTLLGLSVPVFWQGTMLILLFSLDPALDAAGRLGRLLHRPAAEPDDHALARALPRHGERGEHRADDPRLHARRAALGVRQNGLGQGARGAAR